MEFQLSVDNLLNIVIDLNHINELEFLIIIINY